MDNAEALKALDRIIDKMHKSGIDDEYDLAIELRGYIKYGVKEADPGYVRVPDDKNGPRKVAVKLTCTGCPALITERWEEYLDNDEKDSGTNATCSEAKKHISTYWHDGHACPEWCPFATKETSHD